MPEAIRFPLPAALVWAYPALNFNYESWMNVRDLEVLRQESHGNIHGLRQQKDHLSHRSPLSIVEDHPPRRRTKSWSKSFSRLPLIGSGSLPTTPLTETSRVLRAPKSAPATAQLLPSLGTEAHESQAEANGDEEHSTDEDEKSIGHRVRYWNSSDEAAISSQNPKAAAAASGQVTSGPETLSPPRTMETRLTMTSRSACFNDRILSAPMMRSMVSMSPSVLQRQRLSRHFEQAICCKLF